MSGGGRSHLGMAMLLAVALAIGEAGASPSGYSGLVVFGDSLSDSGNAERYGVERIATRIGAELRPSRGGRRQLRGSRGAHAWRRDRASRAGGRFPEGAARRQSRSDGLSIVYAGGNDLLSAEHAPHRRRP
jgi:cholinesterase